MKYTQELHDYLREGQNPVVKGYDLAEVIECLLDAVDYYKQAINDFVEAAEKILEES